MYMYYRINYAFVALSPNQSTERMKLYEASDPSILVVDYRR